MRADSAVEPTKSENITVTWRRSARSSGWALGVPDRVAASMEAVLPPPLLRRAAMASSSFTRCPSAVTPSCFRCSSVKLGRTVSSISFSRNAACLVEESLNLAYHGARAEKQGFQINIERFLDPAAGEVDVFPQEITRALLNLISNGFYAATRRKEKDKGDGYEPTLIASTKNLGDRVEIAIRDNGTGIPPEVKEKMFNPFFTTKPAGEGTGLGLSISHDIIVKQHGGSIEVDTQPGEFTEVRIVLPRVAAFPH